MQKFKLFTIIGPSGVGKGTAIKEIKKLYPNIGFPVSYTTRNKRINEKEGEVYHFITQEKFQDMIKQDQFLEYQKVHNSAYYGSGRDQIIHKLQQQHLIREFDIQGAIAIKESLKDQVVSIFIAVNNWETLEKRIKNRSPISETELAKRKKSYEKEMLFAKKCDYTVYSYEGNIKKTTEEITDIINKYI